MAGRIRSIKPEILEDERSAGLSSDAWRLWVGMWLIADDHGRCRGEPRRLAADIFWACPHVVSVPECLTELATAGVISSYTVRGQQYVSISNWKKHQRIDNAGKPRCPGPEEAEIRGEPPRTSASLGDSPPDLRPPITDLRSPTTTTDQGLSADSLQGIWREETRTQPTFKYDVLENLRAAIMASAELRKHETEDWARLLIRSFMRYRDARKTFIPQVRLSSFLDCFGTCEQIADGAAPEDFAGDSGKSTKFRDATDEFPEGGRIKLGR